MWYLVYKFILYTAKQGKYLAKNKNTFRIIQYRNVIMARFGISDIVSLSQCIMNSDACNVL